MTPLESKIVDALLATYKSAHTLPNEMLTNPVFQRLPLDVQVQVLKDRGVDLQSLDALGPRHIALNALKRGATSSAAAAASLGLGQMFSFTRPGLVINKKGLILGTGITGALGAANSVYLDMKRRKRQAEFSNALNIAGPESALVSHATKIYLSRLPQPAPNPIMNRLNQVNDKVHTQVSTEGETPSTIIDIIRSMLARKS